MSKLMRRAGSQGRAMPAAGPGRDAIVQHRRRRGVPLAESVAIREAIVLTLTRAIAAAPCSDTPYPHWLLRHCMPEEAVDRLLALPFPAPDLGGVSGKRDVHNASRKYFDVENRARFPVCEGFAQAFQDERVTGAIARRFGARLAGTHLRIELAQDTDGFWLEPHTDLGVKAFTMLLYLSREPQHAGLGTDIYDRDKRHAGRSPFEPGAAMVLVPSDVSFHGFEQRRIEGVRKSVIVNYVTAEWRGREQLAFPDRPV
jgi:hypothetical protein